MSLRNLLARELARTLLTGAAEQPVAVERCIRVLGQNPVWLSRLVRDLLRRFRHAWHIGSLEMLAEAIHGHPGFQRAWLEEKTSPRLISPVLDTLFMAPHPWAFANCTLPDVPTVGDIAQWLNISSGSLGWMAQWGYRSRTDENESLGHYYYRWVEKRSGGHRLLEIPKPRLRNIQRRILHELLEYVPAHEAAHGFRRGHSWLSNANAHVKREIVIRLDLQDFFLHIRGARVFGLFRTLGYPEEAARILTGMCINRVPASVMRRQELRGGDGCSTNSDWEIRKRYTSSHLPQGAPTSPALANLCTFRLDTRLQGLAECFGGSYTRYADDLTFSGGQEMRRASERLVSLVGAIVLEEGFVLNYRKTRVMRSSVRQKVTGVIVNQRVNLDRREYDAFKATLYNCVRYGPGSQNLTLHPDFRAHLLGKIAFARHIHPERGKRLLKIFQQIVWEQ